MDLKEIARQIEIHTRHAKPVNVDKGFKEPQEITEALNLIAEAIRDIADKIEK